jgi:two-component sensor histidine kinase
LAEAVRRVAAIALVHDMLAQTADEQVAMDDVVDRLAALVADVAADGAAVIVRREGSAGSLPAALATPLAMVLTELLQNAVEHGSDADGARITVSAGRDREQVRVCVDDGGRGLPPGFDPTTSDRLGLRIVRTLVAERQGSVTWGPSPDGGTRAEVVLPLGRTDPGGGVAGG